MLELGIVGLLLAAVWALMTVDAGLLVVAGAWLVAFGFATGVPLGFIYHVQLYRALRPRGGPPKGWLWRPLSLHGELLPEERPRVLSWCYAGAAGFVVLFAGIIAATAGLLREGGVESLVH